MNLLLYFLTKLDAHEPILSNQAPTFQVEAVVFVDMFWPPVWWPHSISWVYEFEVIHYIKPSHLTSSESDSTCRMSYLGSMRQLTSVVIVIFAEYDKRTKM